MNTIDLDVEGMTCGACVQRVTAALMPIDGVHNVAVDLKAGHVRITSDAAVAPSRLIEALSARRYESQVSTRGSPLEAPPVLSPMPAAPRADAAL